jgi:NitT/TauT family transport system ATP-binding protein
VADKAPLLSVKELKKTYASATGPVEAIGSITFDVHAGELVCIVGPSGCGKTTLLKCLSGLLAPTSGSVRLDGAEVTAPPKKMAVVFQEYGRSLYPWLTVADNVALPLRAQGIGKAERTAAVERAVEEVGLGHAMHKYPWQLSGGMQQRVAIARAVAYQPEVLVMDEPFAAVDAQTRADLEDLVRRVWQDLGVTVLFVTHDIDESVYLGERVLMLTNSPTTIQEDLAIDLPAERDQISTRALPRFTELRTHVYEQIQRAKRGELVR